MAHPIPLILCGLREEIAQGVKKGLEPEYEVIHSLLSTASAANELPSLLLPSNHKPPATVYQPQIGTQNYAAPPRGILLGAGYGENEVAAMRAACVEAGVPNDGWGYVPWVRLDTKVASPPMSPEYGRLVVVRAKECLERLKREGRFEAGRQEGGSEWY